MAHIDRVSGKSRKVSGSTASRRLRASGLVPCNVYGHKQNPTLFTLGAEEADALARSGTLVLDLDVDGAVEKALVKDVQWDTFCTHVLHVDFLRVDANERIRLDVPLQLRGNAPGVVMGGVLEVPHHTVTIECLAVEVPDFLIVKVGALEIGGQIHVKDLTELPPGVNVISPPDLLLVHVVEPKTAPEPVLEAATDAGAQPALVKPPAEKDAKDQK